MQTREEIQQPAGPVPEEQEFPAFNTASFPPQLIWLAITFILLYVVLARLALPRVGQVMGERQDRIADDLDEAERMRAEANEIQQGYEATLAEARAKAQSMLSKARDEARERHDTRMRELEARLDEKVADAQNEIAKAQKQALSELDELAREAAGDVVDKILGERADGPTIEKAVAAATAQRGKAA